MIHSSIVQAQTLLAPHHTSLEAQAYSYYKENHSSKIILCAKHSENSEAMRGQVEAVPCGGERKFECSKAVFPKGY